MMSERKKQVRTAFRNAVLKRDGHRCVMCGRSEGRLDAHHITDRNELPAGGYVVENGITLCDEGENPCHMRAEQYHISGSCEEEFHPLELYRRIGSSYGEALEASRRLHSKLHP